MNANTNFIPIPTRKGLRMVDESRLRKEMEDFEEGFPDGVYAAPSSPKSPRIRVHELFAYCKKYGKDPESLDKKEMEQFLEYE